jgi:hypothetical protein
LSLDQRVDVALKSRTETSSSFRTRRQWLFHQ